MLNRKKKVAMTTTPVIAVGMTLFVAGCGGSGGGTNSNNPHQVVVRLANRSVSFAAFQDGVGAWHVATPSGGTISGSVTDSAGRYGLMIVEDTNAPSITVFQGTLSEANTLDLAPISGFQDLTGAVSGLTEGQALEITPPGNPGVKVQANENYSVTLVRHQPWDLIAALRTEAGTLSFDVRRDLDDVANPVVNFNATFAGFKPADSFTFQADPVGPGTASGVTLHTVNHTAVFLGGQREGAATFFAPNASQRLGADRYEYAAQRFSTTTFAEVDLFKSAPETMALAAPALTPAAVMNTVSSGGKHLAHATWQPDPSAQLHKLEFDAGVNSYVFFVTKGALGASPQKSFTSPDFSALPGWNNAWNLPAALDFATLQSISANLNVHDQITPPNPIPTDTRATTWTSVTAPAEVAARHLASAGRRNRPALLGGLIKTP